jgi:hypothetical protein
MRWQMPAAEAEDHTAPTPVRAAPATDGGAARRLLLRAFERSPFWLDPFYELLRRYAVPLLRSRHPVRRLVGTGRDGRAAAVLVGGDVSKLDVKELAHAFFLTPPDEVSVGSVAGPALARRLADMLDSHDLVLARTWNMFVPEAAAVGLLTLPHLPELRLAVGPVESMLAAANQETRRRVRRCDDQGYRLEVSAGSERFDEFYHNYHLPFVRKRHGVDSVEHPPEMLRRRLRRGGISWAGLDGERLFAVAFEIVGETFRELVAGTPEGRTDRVVQRARYASRAGHIRLSAERGVRWLSFGGCRPWLSDGMLASKRGWGGELVPRPDDLRSSLVGWRRWTPAIARFLADYPLLVRAPGGFAAITAAPDSRTPPSYWRDRAPRGLRQLHVVARLGVLSTGLVHGVSDRTTAFEGRASSAELSEIVRSVATSG